MAATVVLGAGLGIAVLGGMAMVAGDLGVAVTPTATAVTMPTASPVVHEGIAFTGDSAKYIVFLKHAQEWSGDGWLMTEVRKVGDADSFEGQAKQADRVSGLAKAEVMWLDRNPPAGCYGSAWDALRTIWVSYEEGYAMLADGLRQGDADLVQRGSARIVEYGGLDEWQDDFEAAEEACTASIEARPGAIAPVTTQSPARTPERTPTPTKEPFTFADYRAHVMSSQADGTTALAAFDGLGESTSDIRRDIRAIERFAKKESKWLAGHKPPRGADFCWAETHRLWKDIVHDMPEVGRALGNGWIAWKREIDKMARNGGYYDVDGEIKYNRAHTKFLNHMDSWDLLAQTLRSCPA